MCLYFLDKNDMSFLQIILIANIIVLCAYLIHLWDICPYREKTNQNVLIKAIIDTSKANVAITVVSATSYSPITTLG